MKKLIPIIALAALVLPANAFVLMGPSDPTATVNEQTIIWPGSSGVASANVNDTLYGTPKDKHRFFRLNTPYLTYGFHESFVQYFGAEGVVAIDEAMRVINDFFIPEDGSYRGMSELDLIKHGFSGNFATWWRNQTAANENLIDLKSLTLGMVVNRLGLGNPHRYAFTAYGVDTSTTATTFQAIFRTKLNNYDPLTYEQTDRINDIQYSYRLIHDQPAGTQVTVANVTAMNMDMEEFTSSIEDHTYSAVSAIQDAFYGTTDIVWTQPPSKFGFGIFYDGLNAMGGMYQPRHALTFDDAGGLKYLYNKDNVVMEYNPWQALQLADYTAVVQKYGKDLPVSSDPFINLKSGVFPIRNAGAVTPVPTAGDPLQFFRNPTVALPGMTAVIGGVVTPITISFFSAGNSFVGGTNPQKIDWAYRGGIETIQIKKMVYDSLLDTTPEPMAFEWEDVFMTNLAIRASSGGIAPGTTATVKPAPAMYFTQVVNRVVSQPDFLFLAGPLGQSAAGTPIAYIENMSFDMISSTGAGTRPTFHNMVGGTLAPGNYATGIQTVIATGNGTANPQIGMPFGAAVAGPGIWAPAADFSTVQVTFNNEFNMGGFEVIWSGETTVLGNTNAVTISQQNWAHIKGPGPLDYKKFPDRIDNQAASYYREWENTIFPSTGVPSITALSDNQGVTPSVSALARTSEKLTIMGNHFRNAVALEVVNDQGAAVETIYPIASFVKSNNLIEVPAGTFTFSSEGDKRRIVIWTTETKSDPSENSFTIHTGPVIITATSHDGKAYDVNDALTVYGQGFKSLGYNLFNVGEGTSTIPEDGNTTATSVRLLTSTGDMHWPLGGAGAGDFASFGIDISNKINVVSDEKLIISGAAFPSAAAGANIFLTLSRGNNPSLSAMPSLPLAYISEPPRIDNLFRGLVATPGANNISMTVPLHRDKDVTIQGVGLNTVTKIEFIRESGLSYVPPVDVTLNSLNWTAEDDGTEARITANAITQSNADGFGAYRSKMKITTDMGEYIFPTAFNINRKPDTTLTIGGLTGSTTDPAIPYDGSVGYVWDYMGNDRIVLQNLGGMRAIKEIRIAPVVGAWFLPVPQADGGSSAVIPTLTINDAPGTTPGVTVTDTSITLDTNLINFNGIDKAAVARTITQGWRKFVLVCEDNSTITGSDTRSGIARADWNISANGVVGTVDGIQHGTPGNLPGHADIETTVNVLIGRYPVITDATVGFNRYKATSTSSVALSSGVAKTFTVADVRLRGDLRYLAGDRVMVSDAADPANFMSGPVTSYNTANGELVFTPDAINGTQATYNSWNIDLNASSSVFNLVRTFYEPNNAANRYYAFGDTGAAIAGGNAVGLGSYNNATITGTGLNYVTRIDITDDTGLPLTGLNSGNLNSVSVPQPDEAGHGSRADFNATFLPPTVATRTSDSVSNNRRIRIMTPFGTTFSTPPVTTPNAAEAFTLSAAPVIGASAIIAYSGTYGIAPATADDVPSYDSQNLLTAARMPLVIKGSNFGGVRKIEFYGNDGSGGTGAFNANQMVIEDALTLTVDPMNSPVAFFNANMDTITIPATWMDTVPAFTSPEPVNNTGGAVNGIANGNPFPTIHRLRHVRLTMVHGEVVTLPEYEANATYNQ